MSSLGVLRAIGERGFVMADAAVMVRQQRGGFIADDGSLQVRASKIADRIQGAPGRCDEDLDFDPGVSNGNGSAKISMYAAELGQDISGKMIEILGQLGLCGTGRPVADDRSGRGLRR